MHSIKILPEFQLQEEYLPLKLYTNRIVISVKTIAVLRLLQLPWRYEFLSTFLWLKLFEFGLLINVDHYLFLFAVVCEHRGHENKHNLIMEKRDARETVFGVLGFEVL